MSILLSDWEIVKVLPADTDSECGVCDKIAKAAAIHAVQYLEGKCEEHMIDDDDIPYDETIMYLLYGWAYYLHKFMCPDCMKQVREELGI